MDLVNEFSENERLYFQRFLQQDLVLGLKELLRQSRQNGHYQAFLNAHNLEEYTFKMGVSSDA